jgi:hypothetical protein
MFMMTTTTTTVVVVGVEWSPINIPKTKNFFEG